MSKPNPPASGRVSSEKAETSSDLRQLPPPDLVDAVIEVYKKDVDRSLLRENLRLTPQQRCEKFERMMEMVFELRRQADHRRGRT